MGKYTNQQFIAKAKLVHGDVYDYSLVEYKQNKLKVDIICNKHGVFQQIPNGHISQKQGCPICRTSQGEKFVSKYLKGLGIRYEREKKFPILGSLRYDFYLPDHNIIIEFDGPQHRKPVDFFGGVKAFKKLRQHDKIKNKFCEANQIILYRLTETDLSGLSSIIKLR